MNYLLRTYYLNQLIELNNTPDIKVVTGVRRAGKSVLMEEYAAHLKETEKDINLVIIKLQELEYEELLEYHKLNQYIMDKYVQGKHNVLIIDEVQLCENFERVINSVHSKHIYDIYITGSNAFLLSSNLATLFTGRTMEVKVYPFLLQNMWNTISLMVMLMIALTNMSVWAGWQGPMRTVQKIKDTII